MAIGVPQFVRDNDFSDLGVPKRKAERGKSRANGGRRTTGKRKEGGGGGGGGIRTGKNPRIPPPSKMLKRESPSVKKGKKKKKPKKNGFIGGWKKWIMNNWVLIAVGIGILLFINR